MKRLHVLVIDDDRIYALGLKAWLKGLNPRACVRACDAVPFDGDGEVPDVVLVDPEMAGVRYTSMLREIRRRYPRSRIVVLSRGNWFEEGLPAAAMSAGADAFFRKGQPDAELFVTLVNLVAAGGRSASAPVAARALAAS